MGENVFIDNNGVFLVEKYTYQTNACFGNLSLLMISSSNFS